jgi:hypothetical protein
MAFRRIAAELAMLAAIGLLVGLLAPYDSDGMPPLRRYLYWFAAIVGGGLIGVALDETLGRRLSPAWRRVVAVSLIMTPLVGFYVVGLASLMFGGGLRLPSLPWSLTQVLPLCFVVMAVRALVWRKPVVRVETRTVIEPPLPEAEAVFRRRLSARRRAAALIAVEAYDHYLKVHTEAGEELITARFADALRELAQAHGYRTHRSWWVAAPAIQAVRWRRGVGEAALTGGLTVPVSRNFAPVLKAAGWT